MSIKIVFQVTGNVNYTHMADAILVKARPVLMRLGWDLFGVDVFKNSGIINMYMEEKGSIVLLSAVAIIVGVLAWYLGVKFINYKVYKEQRLEVEAQADIASSINEAHVQGALTDDQAAQAYQDLGLNRPTTGLSLPSNLGDTLNLAVMAFVAIGLIQAIRK